MRTRTNLVIDAVLVTAYVAAANPGLTGTSSHEWIALGFALFALVHLVRHRDWVTRMARRLFQRMAARSKVDLAADAVTAIAAASVTVTGLAISRSLAAAVGLAWQAGDGWRTAHLASAWVLLASVVLHAALHWRWIARAFKLHVVDPIDAALQGVPGKGARASAVAWGVPALLVSGMLTLAALGAGNVALAQGTTRIVGATSATVATADSGANSTSSSGGTLTCPRTGCTASTCHGATGAPPPSR